MLPEDKDMWARWSVEELLIKGCMYWLNLTISYIDDDNKSHTITTKLEKYDYDMAIEAHQAGKYVKVIGMVNEGRKNTMECEAFCIID